MMKLRAAASAKDRLLSLHLRRPEQLLAAEAEYRSAQLKAKQATGKTMEESRMQKLQEKKLAARQKE